MIMVNTGKMILDYIVKHRLSKTEFGAKFNRNALSVLNYTRSSSIKTQILVSICHATKHNFFRDIADLLPADYTKTKPDDTSVLDEKDALIAQLKEENKVLKVQNELLMKIRS
jgi:DNA-binding Xre family transcriptional regulator